MYVSASNYKTYSKNLCIFPCQFCLILERCSRESGIHFQSAWHQQRRRDQPSRVPERLSGGQRSDHDIKIKPRKSALDRDVLARYGWESTWYVLIRLISHEIKDFCSLWIHGYKTSWLMQTENTPQYQDTWFPKKNPKFFNFLLALNIFTLDVSM